MAVALSEYPNATQSEVLPQDTPCRIPWPEGSACACQVAPPSVVTSIAPDCADAVPMVVYAPPAIPTATHMLVVGQETPITWTFGPSFAWVDQTEVGVAAPATAVPASITPVAPPSTHVVTTAPNARVGPRRRSGRSPRSMRIDETPRRHRFLLTMTPPAFSSCSLERSPPTCSAPQRAIQSDGSVLKDPRQAQAERSILLRCFTTHLRTRTAIKRELQSAERYVRDDVE